MYANHCTNSDFYSTNLRHLLKATFRFHKFFTIFFYFHIINIPILINKDISAYLGEFSGVEPLEPLCPGVMVLLN